jgi:hydroxymethylbilane synthase
MATARLVCASRASALAMVQTRTVAARLAERGIVTTILPITTIGDRERDRAIDRIGSVNVFVGELESALRDGRADYAVHSCKDLPSTLADDMRLAAISKREDPRDAYCSQRYPSFEALPPGAVVGTSSPRRIFQLRAARPDLDFRTIRGNVDTRLRKLADGGFDAIVLAMAGLLRLRAGAPYIVPLDLDVCVPAVGQGALAVETRAGDDWVAAQVRDAVNDVRSELCVLAERSGLRAMQAGCSAPIGIYAEWASDCCEIRGVADAEPPVFARREATIENAGGAEALGIALASDLRPGQRRDESPHAEGLTEL